MDTFTQAYIECALWCGLDEEDRERCQGAPELAPVTLKQMQDECADFQASYAALLASAYAVDGYSEERAGHDFWLTRNGHGAGFWDRGLGELGTALTEASKPYGTRDLYFGDDGFIYSS